MHRILLVALIFFSLPSCVGKHPVKQIQLCLIDEANTTRFIQIMKEISAAHDMRFIDRSLETNKELRVIGREVDYEIMNISAVGEDGVGWAAGNSGLSEFEVSIGFNGPSSTASLKFANVVTRTLEQTWPVYHVPQGSGAVSRCSPIQRPLALPSQKPNNSFKPKPLRGSA